MVCRWHWRQLISCPDLTSNLGTTGATIDKHLNSLTLVFFPKHNDYTPISGCHFEKLKPNSRKTNLNMKTNYIPIHTEARILIFPWAMRTKQNLSFLNEEKIDQVRLFVFCFVFPYSFRSFSVTFFWGFVGLSVAFELVQKVST